MEFAAGGAGTLPELNEADFDHTDPDAAQDIYRQLAASRGHHVHYTTRETA